MLLRDLPPARAATVARIEVLPDEPIGRILPALYGHFAEHIGGVVYDGIWVGEDSKIPNLGGIRREIVEHMRRLGPSVVRWPGGCFADATAGGTGSALASGDRDAPTSGSTPPS